MPSPEFSQNYRHDLALRLYSLPTDRQTRHQILTEAQNTLDYQLAKHERTAYQQGVDFSSKPTQEQKQFQQEQYKLMYDYYMSNESSLYKLFPAIKDIKGTIVAVGSDQGLDLFVNSQAQHLLVVDINTETSQLTRTLLEIGSIHKKIFGSYPNVEQYHEYFKVENIHHISRLLSDTLGNRVENIVHTKLSQPILQNKQSQYYNYLKYKSQLINDNGQPFSWNSSDENLRQIFEAYDQGRIFVINRDLYSEESIDIINGIVNSRKSSFQVLYVSNSLSYIENQKVNLCHIISKLLKAKPIVLATTKDDETVHPQENQNNISLRMTDWHYLATSSTHVEKSVEQEIKRRRSRFPFDLLEDRSRYSPEPGVTFLGI